MLTSNVRDMLTKNCEDVVINFAEEIDRFADIVLVGDSLGSVLYNFSTTRKVTLADMIKHSKSVRQGVKKSLMVVDMPFNT